MSSHDSGMQGIDIENTWIESSAVHVESMLPEFIALSAPALGDYCELMLERTDGLTFNYVLRQPIIHIDVTKNRSVVQFHVMRHFMTSAVQSFRMKAGLYWNAQHRKYVIESWMCNA